MKERNLRVAHEDIQVVEGKVVISSEELATAIQQYSIDLEKEEMAEGDVYFQLFCRK